MSDDTVVYMMLPHHNVDYYLSLFTLCVFFESYVIEMPVRTIGQNCVSNIFFWNEIKMECINVIIKN